MSERGIRTFSGSGSDSSQAKERANDEMNAWLTSNATHVVLVSIASDGTRFYDNTVEAKVIALYERLPSAVGPLPSETKHIRTEHRPQLYVRPIAASAATPVAAVNVNTSWCAQLCECLRGRRPYHEISAT